MLSASKSQTTNTEHTRSSKYRGSAAVTAVIYERRAFQIKGKRRGGWRGFFHHLILYRYTLLLRQLEALSPAPHTLHSFPFLHSDYQLILEPPAPPRTPFCL